jgi:hypothetical protein
MPKAGLCYTRRDFLATAAIATGAATAPQARAPAIQGTVTANVGSGNLTAASGYRARAAPPAAPGRAPARAGRA